jgi:hypothetical protein
MSTATQPADGGKPDTSANTNPAGQGTSTTTQPAPGEEYKSMSPEAFKARLAAEREAGAKGVLKDLGVEKADEAKARLAEDQKRRDAEKSELQRAQDEAKSLKPKAEKADTYEASLKRYLESEEKAIPEAKRGLLDLAPPATDINARLDWISNAKAKGLFNVEAQQTQQNANTRAGGNPPPAAKPGTKHPRDMSPEEFTAYQQAELTRLGSQ